ncbi:uncharacterized protein LOC133841443 isoform X12 [Drosophila sulfurigaster albostrigata]|uniref:uncharacterized protein LOC133841443 isoform X12 n=1 Tax=Drosophila sulfurigaster albostrigata TaxID=89887 RepID=UPI002D21940B|nr:uncharacterized protein LOC133841443 isoform X12 [Drosophila sulfurigaster albostrigata]
MYLTDLFYIFILILLLTFLCVKSIRNNNSEDYSADDGRASNSTDRQNNIELGRQNNRYGDIFFIEPNSQEAARIREQLEKDEKDLPSYDEVMRMCNLTTPTAAAAASPSLPTSPVVETGPIGIVALPAPPYSETDPNPSSIVVSPSALESAPSTSRAAQIPA